MWYQLRDFSTSEDLCGDEETRCDIPEMSDIQICGLLNPWIMVLSSVGVNCCATHH